MSIFVQDIEQAATTEYMINDPLSPFNQEWTLKQMREIDIKIDNDSAHIFTKGSVKICKEHNYLKKYFPNIKSLYICGFLTYICDSKCDNINIYSSSLNLYASDITNSCLSCQRIHCTNVKNIINSTLIGSKYIELGDVSELTIQKSTIDCDLISFYIDYRIIKKYILYDSDRMIYEMCHGVVDMGDFFKFIHPELQYKNQYQIESARDNGLPIIICLQQKPIDNNKGIYNFYIM